LTATRYAAASAADEPSMAATTASARSFGLPKDADCSANAATSAAALTISSGIPIVLALATFTSTPTRIASTNAR